MYNVHSLWMQCLYYFFYHKIHFSWDQTYSKELENFRNHGDSGEIW